jgi:hypothetical protein
MTGDYQSKQSMTAGAEALGGRIGFPSSLASPCWAIMFRYLVAQQASR